MEPRYLTFDKQEAKYGYSNIPYFFKINTKYIDYQ